VSSDSVSVSPRKFGVVAITHRAGRFLAIRRGSTVAAGGTICFPGGHIEPGEREDEAVECVWRNVTDWGTSLAWWTVRFVGAEHELVPHPVEVSEILWLSAAEMLEHPDLLQGNRLFLEAVIEGRFKV